MRLSCWLALPLALPLALVACGADAPVGDDAPDAAPDPEPILEPPPEGQGYQFTMTAEIPAGVEGEWCQFVRGPEVEYWIQRDQVVFTAGSHHFLLYETGYDEIPTMNDDGEVIDTSGVFDCSDGPTAGWTINRLLGGSQNGDGESIVGFPEGVAMHVRADAVLLMNAHYLNATTQTLEPQVAINLWTTPGDQVETEGDILFLYNPFISVPANGTGRAHWKCPVHDDITIVNAQSHMHKRGVGYAAMVAGQAPFYENDRWAEVPVAQFDGGMQVAAGEELEYWCDYDNGEDRVVHQGPRTTDEMCMLIGAYYPADPRTSNCLTADGGLGGEWVGQGTATCAASWQCMLAAFQSSALVDGVSDCIAAADPAVSAPLSAALRCVANSDDPLSTCAPEIDACNAL